VGAGFDVITAPNALVDDPSVETKMITTTANTTNAPPKIPAVALVLLPLRPRLGAGRRAGCEPPRFGARFVAAIGWPSRSRARSSAANLSASGSAVCVEARAVADLDAVEGAPDRRVVEERLPVPGGRRFPLPDLRGGPLFAILLRFPFVVKRVTSSLEGRRAS
jgi:hypothetical protein